MVRSNCRRISTFITIKVMIFSVCVVSLFLIVLNFERIKFMKRSMWITSGSNSTKEVRYSFQMASEIQTNLTRNLSWFFTNGKILPEISIEKPNLFPEDENGDRIINQLMYIPSDYKGEKSPMKLILDPGRVYQFYDNAFAGCPVNRCSLIFIGKMKKNVHAVLIKGTSSDNIHIEPHQIGILYNLESPRSSNDGQSWSGINWTATYRSDSDIVAPYARWTYYNPNVTQISQTRNYAAYKTKKVAWFVSNCFADNDRLQYAKVLSEYITVDIYGQCGFLKCPRTDHARCLQLLDTDYKFYLAFENSNCRDYITEKFFVNGLGANVLPIVMGAKREDYLLIAPANSFLHVDDFDNPRHLANFLHHLDQDDDLYNSYFRWKGTGEFINTFFWCRLCALLHGSPKPRSHKFFHRWWEGNGICWPNSWKKS